MDGQQHFLHDVLDLGFRAELSTAGPRHGADMRRHRRQKPPIGAASPAIAARIDVAHSSSPDAIVYLPVRD